VFVTITPGQPSLWSGVLFVRKGPYAPSVLRFQLSFLSQFPVQPPLITFSSDIFHPLLTPLTTYTASGMDTVSASDQEILPPGGFSLRHGFPAWFPSLSSGSGSSKKYSVYQILEYIRHAFNDEDFLDSIPLNSVANPGAYHAWHTFRNRKLQARALSPQPGLSSKRNSGLEGASGSSVERSQQNAHRKQWNWDGVWEERVKRGIQSSLSHQALFGNAAAADDMIRFSNISPEDFELILDQIRSKGS
jgi:Ubiquitin-conjugating enzyme